MAWLIGITDAKMLPGEGRLIEAALAGGADYVHIRKPGASDDDVRRLLLDIAPAYRHRLVLHDCYALASEYGLRGIHVNGRHSDAEAAGCRLVSRGCHTLDEVASEKGKYDYLFLSPIYDSISKPGYRAAFDPATLQEAARAGIIDSKVVALGGITPGNAAEAMGYGFGGVAVLGYLWRDPQADAVEKAASRLRACMAARE